MSWDGKERRHIDVEFIYEEVEKIKISHARLEEKVVGFLDTTGEYRRSLCSKLDGIVKKLDGIECPVHRVKMDSMSDQIKWMWGVVGVVFMAIVAVGIKELLK